MTAPGSAPDPDEVFRLFAAATEAAPSDPRAWLAARCDDPAVRDRVLALLATDARASADSGFLSSPIRWPERSADAPAPRVIGAYRIVRELGRGGMGTVYEAAQERPARTVALKLIHPDQASPESLRRFAHEAEVLARLDHPGIAHVYEAGVTADPLAPDRPGTPWFAMEHVRGERLDAWVTRENPGTDARLRVLAEIAAALQHAHQKGVIHRDIKPANIIVTSDGRPKLLDFGVARFTNDTLQTGVGRMIGTLAYMSPEQLEGDPGRVDVRSDVYALGVVAYQILTGRLPHDTTNLSLPTAVRAILDQTPERPGRIAPELRGDAETVVMTAMAKEPARRYPSASEFGADLRRVLAHEPISARPATVVYQLRCFTRRHRAVVAISGVACAAVLIALAVVSVQAVRLDAAAEELDRRAAAAEREASRATAVSGFLERVLSAPDPFADEPAGPEVTVGELLTRSGPWLDTAFAGDPFAESAARAVVGRTHKGLGQFQEAEDQLRLAIERLDATGMSGWRDDERVRFAGLLTEHAVTLVHLDRTPEALEQLDRASSVAATVERTPARAAAARLGNSGWVLRSAGRPEQAAGVLREALTAAQDAGPEADQERALILVNLAGALVATGQPAEAIGMYDGAREIILDLHGPGHPYLIVIGNNIGRHAMAVGDAAGAERAFGQAADLLAASLGENHPRTLIVLNNLAYAQHELGSLGEADRTYRRALAGVLAHYGADHREYLGTLRNHAWLLWDMERYEEAARAWTTVANGFREHPGQEGLLALLYDVYAAAMLHMAGPPDASTDDLLAAHDRLTRRISDDDPLARSALRRIIPVLERAGREDLLPAYRARFEGSGSDPAP